MKPKQKYTQQQVDNRLSDRVCWECGYPFLTDYQKSLGKQIGMGEGKCGLCRKNKPISHISDWNYLRLPEVKYKLNKTEKLLYDIFRLCDRTVWLEDFKEFQKEFENILKANNYNLWKIYFNVPSEKVWLAKCQKSWLKYEGASKNKKARQKASKHYYIKNRKYKVKL